MSENGSKRSRRVADLIHREVALIIQKEVHDPRLKTLSITFVDSSSDLSNAKIYYVLHDASMRAEVQAALEKASGFIKTRLSKQLDMRYTPKLTFAYDESLSQAERISSLIDKVSSQEEKE